MSYYKAISGITAENIQQTNSNSHKWGMTIETLGLNLPAFKKSVQHE